MTLSKPFGLLVKSCPYIIVLLGGMTYTYIERHSPRQPDPASGHVFRVMAPRHRHTPKHAMYLTGSERTLYHGSFIVMAVGTFGILAHLFMIKKRNYDTSQRNSV